MVPITKQDVQTIVEQSRTRILERVALRQDILNLQETMKSLLTTAGQNQQLLRQAEFQRTQLVRKVSNLESRITALEQELKPLRSTMTKVVEKQVQPQMVVFGSDTKPKRTLLQQQYLYQPE